MASVVPALAVSVFALRTAPLSSAPANDDAARASAGTTRTFTVIAPDAERTIVDTGRNGPTRGDMLVFSGPVNDEQGSRIGRIDGVCTTTGTPPNLPGGIPRERERRLCSITVSLDRPSGQAAEISLQGVGRLLAEDVVLAVTGGTRSYKNASGQATVDYRTTGQISIEFEITS